MKIVIKNNTIEENKIMIKECFIKIKDSEEIIDHINMWPDKYSDYGRKNKEMRKIQINKNNIRRHETNIREINRRKRLEEIKNELSKIDKK